MKNSTRIFTALGIVFLYSAAAHAGIDDGLVGYWKFEEGVGTTVTDVSGNGNVGTLYNSPAWASGKSGKGIYLTAGRDGNWNDGQWMQTGKGFGGNRWSIALWMKPDLPIPAGLPYYNGYYFLSSSDSQTPGEQLLGIRDNGIFRLLTSLAKFSFSGQTGWRHIVISYDGKNLVAAIDGQIRGTKDDWPNPLPTSERRRIGSLGGRTNNFSGSMDEVRLYNRGLSLKEIAILYDPGNAFRTQPPTITEVLYPREKLPSWSRYSHISLKTSVPAQCRGALSAGLDYVAMPFSIGDYSPYEQITPSPPSIYIKDLEAKTTDITYTYYVKCVDSAGNVSAEKSVNVTVAADTKAPEFLSSISASSVREDSADITWLTSEPATSFVEFGTNGSHNLSSSEDPSLAIPHAVVLSHLTPGRTYSYKVHSTDAVGNRAVSASYTFTTTSSNTNSQIYVDGALGNDNNSGLQGSPVKTLTRAQTLVRGMPKTGGITVWIKGGAYYLDTSLTFLTGDSGSPGDPVVYRGYPGEEVRISAGKKIPSSSWQPVTAANNPSAYNRLPAAARGHVLQSDLRRSGINDYGIMDRRASVCGPIMPIADLYSDRDLLRVARWPNTGWLTIDHQVEGAASPTFVAKDSLSGKSWQLFSGSVKQADFSSLVVNPSGLWSNLLSSGYIASTGAIQPKLLEVFNDSSRMVLDPAYQGQKEQIFNVLRRSVNNVWAYGYWAVDYASTYENVLSLNAQSGTVAVAQASIKADYCNGAVPTGVFTKGMRFYFGNILDELDQVGEYYLDRASGMLYLWPPADYPGEYYVTALDNLLRISNAHDITFCDIIFEGARLSGITLAASQNIVFQNAEIRHMGLDAANFESGSGVKDSGFFGCRFHSIGATAIQLGGSGGTDPAAASGGRNFVENCEITNIGKWLPNPAFGVSCMGGQNRVMHNHIHDANAQGIYSQGFNHLIAYNELNNLVHTWSDAGFIYWGGRGSIIKYNYLHDGFGYNNAGVNGIYHDSISSGTTDFGNVLQRIQRNSIHINGGRNNLVENNILVGGNTRLGLSVWQLHAMGIIVPIAVVGATKTSPIVVTLARPHHYPTGTWNAGIYYLPPTKATIVGVMGNTGANGAWDYEVVSPTQLRLLGSIGNGDYAGGGTSLLDKSWVEGLVKGRNDAYFNMFYPKEAAWLDEGDAGQPRGNEFVRNIVYDADPDIWFYGTLRDQTFPFLILKQNLFNQNPFVDYPNGNFTLTDSVLRMGFKQIPVGQIGFLKNTVVGIHPPASKIPEPPRNVEIRR